MRGLSLPCLAGLCLLLAACASPVVSEFTVNRMVAVDDDGSPRLYAIEKSGRTISPGEYSYARQLDGMMAAIKESGRKKIGKQWRRPRKQYQKPEDENKVEKGRQRKRLTKKPRKIYKTKIPTKSGFFCLLVKLLL